MNIGILYLCMSFIYILLICLDGEDVIPRNDNGKILAFSKVNSNMNAMLYETACYTYQGKQEVRVREYTFTDLLFVEDLLDLIKKGGNHD